MKVLLVERHEAPVFAGVIDFRVGGVDEHVGITGLAHMFEHMAFKGTRVIGTKNYAAELAVMRRVDAAAEALRRYMATPHPDPAEVERRRSEIARLEAEARPYTVKDEFDEIYNRNGANDVNAFTARDLTSYHVELPSNRFELWCLMESQRMAAPVLREFYSERNVVAEERRMRTETQPIGKLFEEVDAAAYEAHPYGSPTIGWMTDIQNLTRPQAIAFRKHYYVPNNAVAVIVGDLHPAQAWPIIDRYFGAIPPGEAPPPVTTREPAQRGERRTEVEFQAQPISLIAYHKPTLPDDDDFVFSILDLILTSGRTSRLYKSLVQQQQIVTTVESDTAYPGIRYPNLYLVLMVPRYPHTSADAEKALYAELDRLKTEPVSAMELEKAKNIAEVGFIQSLKSNLGLAQQLAETQTVAGDWRYLLTWRQRVQKITAADVQRVARAYLTRQNRTVGTLVPTGDATGGPTERSATGGQN